MDSGLCTCGHDDRYHEWIEVYGRYRKGKCEEEGCRCQRFVVLGDGLAWVGSQLASRDAKIAQLEAVAEAARKVANDARGMPGPDVLVNGEKWAELWDELHKLAALREGDSNG